MNELKPCPFCGGKASVRSEHDSDGFGNFHYVACGSCGAKSRYHFAGSGNDCPQHYSEVRASWNMRFEPLPEDKGR